MAGTVLHKPTLVGREVELGRLCEQLEAASVGEGTAIVISGEPGIGKTRLVSEFCSRAVAKGVLLLSGAAQPDSARPFEVISCALAGRAEIFSDTERVSFSQVFAIDNAGMLMAKASASEQDMDADIFAGMFSAVQNFVQDSLGTSGQQSAGLGRLEYGDLKILVEHGSRMFLAAVISGTEHPDMKASLKDAVRNMEAEHAELLVKWTGNVRDAAPLEADVNRVAARRFTVRRSMEGLKLENELNRISDRTLEALDSAAGERTLLLLLEDLHWADEPSLAVLNYLARNASDRRMMVLGTSRDGQSKALESRVEGMKAEGIVSELVLKKLEPGSVMGIVDSVCPGNRFPGDFVAALAERCGGTPLFVVELLRHMASEGSIVWDGGAYILVREDYSIPGTVDEVIEGRLAGLSTEALTLAEYASCIGREFSREAVFAAPVVSDPMAAFSELCSGGLFVTEGGNAQFSHAMYQAAVYESLTTRWRTAHHRSIGEYYETGYAGRESEVAYELARHFSRTKENAKTLGYCTMAGDKAASSFAAEQAVEFYSWALEAIDRLGGTAEVERMRILEAMGDLQTVMGDYMNAETSFGSAGRLAEQGNDRARLMRKSGNLMVKTGDYGKALKLFASAKDESPDGAEHGRGCLAESFVHITLGDFEKAEPLLGHAMATFRGLGAMKDVADALIIRGTLLLKRGDFAEAVTGFKEALGYYEDLNIESGVAQVLSDIGKVCAMMGEPKEAMPYLERSLDIWKKIGNQQSIALTMSHIGNVRTMLGDLPGALEAQEASLRIRERIGDRWGIAGALSNISQIYMYKGDPFSGLEYLEKGLKAFTALGDRHSMAALYNNIGVALSQLGRFDEALERYGLAMEIRSELGDKDGLSQVLYNLGDVHFFRGEFFKVRECLEKSLAIAEEIGNKEQNTWVHCRLAELSAAEKEYVAGLADAEKAVSMAASTGVGREMGMAHRARGIVCRERGELAEAAIDFELARGYFASSDLRNDAAILQYEWALLDARRGNAASARERFGRALAEFEVMGMQHWASMCRAALEA